MSADQHDLSRRAAEEASLGGTSTGIVVVPIIGGKALEGCLRCLPIGGVECIVVLRSDMGSIETWQARFTSVRFVDSEDDCVPARRFKGAAKSTTTNVALIEDTSWPDEGWFQACCAAFMDPTTAAACGPVSVAATLPNRFSALAWSEYGAFVWRAQETDAGCTTVASLPGNNMAFRRKLLIDLAGADNVLESRLQRTLAARALKIVFNPEMIVNYVACDVRNASLMMRMRHGRLYAGTEIWPRGWRVRLVHLAKTTLLPFVLANRKIKLARRTATMRWNLRVFCWLFIMESAWAGGEAIGSLLGPGDSMNAWR